MKTIKLLHLLIITGLLIICIPSCSDKNYKIATQIHKDGSVSKEIYARGDSAFLAGDRSKTPFSFTFDPSWQITNLKATETNIFSSGQNYNVKISKHFQSLKDVSEGLHLDDTLRSLAVPKEALKKQFNWFYTTYTYRGEYKKINTQKVLVPIDQYMSKSEQKIWFQGVSAGYEGRNGMELKDELDVLENQFLTWASRNMYEASFQTIQHFYELSGSNPGLSSDLTSIRDTLFLINSKDIEDKEFEPEDVCDMLDQFYKTTYFSALYEKNQQDIDKYCEKIFNLDTDLFGISIEYQLNIPGKILSANTNLIKQDTLTWKINAVRLITDDYVLVAESQTTNTWAFFVTFFFAIVLIFCTVRIFVKNRNR